MELQPWRCVTQQVKGHNVRFFVFSHEQQDVLLREHEDTALGVCDALRKPRLSVPLCLCTRMQSANQVLTSNNAGNILMAARVPTIKNCSKRESP